MMTETGLIIGGYVAMKSIFCAVKHFGREERERE
jgi:hypothetical protein